MSHLFTRTAFRYQARFMPLMRRFCSNDNSLREVMRSLRLVKNDQNEDIVFLELVQDVDVKEMTEGKVVTVALELTRVTEFKKIRVAFETGSRQNIFFKNRSRVTIKFCTSVNLKALA